MYFFANINVMHAVVNPIEETLKIFGEKVKELKKLMEE